MLPQVNSLYPSQNQTGNKTMSFGTETAAGGALIKFFGAPLLGSVGAIALGFLILWPKTKKEAISRFMSTILFSMFFGPFLVILVRSYYPGLFDNAKIIASMYGVEPAFGFMFIAAPVMVAAGLPAWWILGAVVHWFDKRKDKDIVELATDAIDAAKAVKAAL